MMVPRRDGDAGTAPRGPIHHHKQLGKRSFLAGADRVRTGSGFAISGIYWQWGTAGGGGEGRRGRGAAVSGACKLVEHDSPSIETYGGPVKLWAGGLHGTDLRSGNLAVFASAVLIISC